MTTEDREKTIYHISNLDAYPEITKYFKDVVLLQTKDALSWIVIDSATKHVMDFKHKFQRLMETGKAFDITRYDLDRLYHIIGRLSDPEAIQRAHERDRKREEQRRARLAERKAQKVQGNEGQ